MPFDFARHGVGAVNRILSEPVTHHAGGQQYDDRSGIFHRNHELIDVSGDLPVSTTVPTLAIYFSEWTPRPRPKDQVTVDGELFIVSDVQDHGEDAGLLVLRAGT